jgi:hypothetical protein
MQKRKGLLVLGCLIAVAIVSVAIVFWPTPRRKAMARIEALDGIFETQIDEEGGRHKINCLILASRPVAEPDLIALNDFRPIHRLMLDGCRLDDAWLAHIGTLEELELLSLTGCKLTDGALAHLKALKHLKNLSLRNTPVTDACLAHLHQLTALTFLNVAYTQVTEHGIEELKHSLPGLKRVYTRDDPE